MEKVLKPGDLGLVIQNLQCCLLMICFIFKYNVLQILLTLMQQKILVQSILCLLEDLTNPTLTTCTLSY